MTAGGRTDIYYNPTSYATPTNYSANISGTNTAWMLVNTLGSAGDASGGTRGLQAMATNLTGNYALGKDIDASATVGWNGGAGFTPVGKSTNTFTGNFDGQKHQHSRTIRHRRYQCD